MNMEFSTNQLANDFFLKLLNHFVFDTLLLYNGQQLGP